MIDLLDRLEPQAKISWATYIPVAQIDWLHSGKRILESPDQIYPSSGPSTVIPTAIFSIETYEWNTVAW
jgi:hypothetical protein